MSRRPPTRVSHEPRPRRLWAIGGAAAVRERLCGRNPPCRARGEPCRDREEPRTAPRVSRPPDRDRGLSPVVGTALLVALTVLLAATAGAAVLSSATVGGDPVSYATLTCSATAGTDRIACVHTGGDRLDVRAVTVEIEVAGTPLTHQPPVPFFAARGFHGGPSGLFNSAADPHWSAGETAAVRLASTNHPGLTLGDRVVVRVTRDGSVIAEATTTA